jgi:hypothetical protein
MLSVVKKAFMPSVNLLNVMLTVVMLGVVAPFVRQGWKSVLITKINKLRTKKFDKIGPCRPSGTSIDI